MPLTNSQYDEIIRAYDARQLKMNMTGRTDPLYAYIKIPRLREIDDAIATCSVAQAKKLLDGDTMALNTLKEQIASYRSEKKDLLKKSRVFCCIIWRLLTNARIVRTPVLSTETLPLFYTGCDRFSLYPVEFKKHPAP